MRAITGWPGPDTLVLLVLQAHRETRKPGFSLGTMRFLFSCPTRQVPKMLAVVGVLFALLWLPYRALGVVNSFLSPPYLNRGFLFCRLCIYVNSAVNPIIYALMSQRFWEAFHEPFQCHLARPKAPPRQASLVYYGVIRDCSQHRLGSWKKPGGMMSRQEGDPATSWQDPPLTPIEVEGSP